MTNKSKSRLELQVGLFIIVGLVILVFFVFFIRDFQITRPGYKFNIVFGFANGLKEGSPARLAGVDVGEVKKVDVFYDADASKTKAKVSVWVKHEAVVPSDSEVWINTLGLLGEKYVEIIPGKRYDMLIKSGDSLVGQDPVAMEEITEQTKKLVLKIEEAAGGLNEVLAKIKGGEGTLGKLVYDDAIYQNIEGVTKDLKDLTEDLKSHPWKLLFKPKEKTRK